eukprot:7285797-Ditylum_brightwellii.AAC.1
MPSMVAGIVCMMGRTEETVEHCWVWMMEHMSASIPFEKVEPIGVPTIAKQSVDSPLSSIARALVMLSFAAYRRGNTIGVAYSTSSDRYQKTSPNSRTLDALSMKAMVLVRPASLECYLLKAH